MKTRVRSQIDPSSVAGVLLREFESPRAAMKYALRMAHSCSNPVMASDYADAARQLRQIIAAGQVPQTNQGLIAASNRIEHGSPNEHGSTNLS